MPKVRVIQDIDKVCFYNGMYIILYKGGGFHLLNSGLYCGFTGTESEVLQYAEQQIDDIREVDRIQDRIDEYKKRIKTREQEIEKTKKLIEREEKLLEEVKGVQA